MTRLEALERVAEAARVYRERSSRGEYVQLCAALDALDAIPPAAVSQTGNLLDGRKFRRADVGTRWVPAPLPAFPSVVGEVEVSARDVIAETQMAYFDHTVGELTADAVLGALAAAGLEVVPRQPTQRMLDLAWSNGDENASSVWAAMIAAAQDDKS